MGACIATVIPQVAMYTVINGTVIMMSHYSLPFHILPTSLQAPFHCLMHTSAYYSCKVLNISPSCIYSITNQSKTCSTCIRLAFSFNLQGTVINSLLPLSVFLLHRHKSQLFLFLHCIQVKSRNMDLIQLTSHFIIYRDNEMEINVVSHVLFGMFFACLLFRSLITFGKPTETEPECVTMQKPLINHSKV